MTSLATEDWAGTVAGWPAQWTPNTTGSAVQDRVSGRGRQESNVSFGNGADEYLSGMTASAPTDVTITLSYPNPKVNLYAVVAVRADGTWTGSFPSNGYVVELDILNNAYRINRVTAGTPVQIGATVSKTFTAGTDIKVRLRVIGCMVLVTIWNVGSGEPNPDTLILDDASVYATAGKVALTAQNGTGSVADIFWDDLTVDDMASVPYPYVVANRGSLQSSTASNPFSITLTNPTLIGVGNYLFAYVAMDNIGASGVATTLAVTDSKSNTWTVLAANNRTPGAAANDGTTGRWAYCKVTTAYVATNTVTFTAGGSVTAKAIEIIEVANVHATSPIAVSQTTATGTGTTPSVGITPTAVNQLVLGMVAAEAPSADTWTADTDTTDGPWGSLSRIGSSNATATNNQAVLAQAKVVFGTSAQTFNPTLGTSRDWAATAIVIAPAVTAVANTMSVGGSVTTTGGLVKGVAKPLAGSSTSSGALAKAVARAWAGSSTASGALAKQTGKHPAGSVTTSGTMGRLTGKALSGSSTATGSIVKAIGRHLAGSTTPSGSLAKAVAKAFAGSSTPSGALAKQTSKTLAGSVTPSGVVAVIRAVLLTLTGSVTASGSLVKVTAKNLAGTVTPGGALAKAIARHLAGLSTPSGALRSAVAKAFAGSVTPSGSLSKAAGKHLAGSTTAAGTLSKAAGKSFAGGSTPSGGMAKLVAVALSGSVTSAGTLAKLTSKALAGSVAAVGTLATLASSLGTHLRVRLHGREPAATFSGRRPSPQQLSGRQPVSTLSGSELGHE